jgi:hypothetical protein
MRHIVRTAVAAPKSLTDKGAKGDKERDAARTHFADKAKAGVGFKFTAYKGKDVALAVEQLFHKKCAYCESTIKQVTDFEIEHFRPKGRFDDCDGHSGYWWLAATWDNLLCSCTYCNQRRSHRMVSIGMSKEDLLASEREQSGKASAFPISDPSKYARKEGDCTIAEDPLLIDPTVRDPAKHLTWVSDKDWSLVAPHQHPTGPDTHGWRSIRVYGLNRQDLVEERTGHRLLLATAIGAIEDTLMDAAEDSNKDTRRKRVARALEKFEALFIHCAADKKYSAMVAAFLDSERERLIGKFEQILVSPLAAQTP